MKSVKPIETFATSWLQETDGHWMQVFADATVTFEIDTQEGKTNDQ